jgi:hypothetical protein
MKSKLLKETYKTLAGAQKRCAFENGIAKSEYERGYKAHHYSYHVMQISETLWRVERRQSEMNR